MHEMICMSGSILADVNAVSLCVQVRRWIQQGAK